MDDNQEWQGDERRSSDRRKQKDDRRGEERTIFDRRSGLDRRGHPIYRGKKPEEPVESQVE